MVKPAAKAHRQLKLVRLQMRRIVARSAHPNGLVCAAPQIQSRLGLEALGLHLLAAVKIEDRAAHRQLEHGVGRLPAAHVTEYRIIQNVPRRLHQLDGKALLFPSRVQLRGKIHHLPGGLKRTAHRVGVLHQRHRHTHPPDDLGCCRKLDQQSAALGLPIGVKLQRPQNRLDGRNALWDVPVELCILGIRNKLPPAHRAAVCVRIQAAQQKVALEHDLAADDPAFIHGDDKVPF